MFKVLPVTLEDFYNCLLIESISALKLNTFLDNFDHQTFNHDGIDRSKHFDGLRCANTFRWLHNNYLSLFEAYSLFTSDKEKRLFLNLIAFRLASHFCVKIPIDFDETSEEYKNYIAAVKYTESALDTTGMFGKLKHYDFEYNNAKYVIDCLGLEFYLLRGQYFYNEQGVVIQPEANDYVIDGGACTGDSALVFSNAVGAYGKIYAFDPVYENLEILKYNCNQFPHKNVSVFPYGLSDQDYQCDPIRLNKYSPDFRADQNEVPLRSIDSLIATSDIEKVDFIKLDVEGFELNVLKGAVNTINKFKPKLALSLYHKDNDLFELPIFIKKNFPFYKIHINHYSIQRGETVLYCA